ncbi:tyrosine-type recombinase/integrase [Lysinibacillus sp. 54212]|uniref:tyrosine-type recombinase/integrase n=1 Tax=Lysinibacillus sp. 54212 TaxID=3119829 RepID=UPI002FC5AD9D
MEQKVINFNQAIKKHEVNEAVQEQIDKKTKMYESDFKRFQRYAEQEGLELSFETLEAYLLHTVKIGLKLNTFNRRSASVKHFLVNELGQVETEDNNKNVALLRQKYNDIQFAEQKQVSGQVAQPKDEVVAMIDKLDTRGKAIALFNLITACRPSEMIAIQLKHIDLKNRSVNVYLKKQKEWHTKRLTLEVVNAIKDYINAYGLDSDSYLVGKVDKHNNYTNAQVSDIAYRKSIHKWLGFAPYTLRKTQVSAMHEAGADLATIAKQSGHKNLETINKHYLSVNDRTIDKYL